MVRMISAAALGLALLAVGGVQAAGPTVTLRHQHQAGEKWVRNTTMNVVMVMNVAGNVADGTVSAEETENLAVTAKAADGGWEMTRKATSVARISGIPNAPAEVKEEKPEALFTQDALGKASRVQVPAPEINQQALMNAQKLVQYAMDQLPPLETLPEKAVSVGDTWTVTHAVKGADGRDQKIDVRYKLFAYSDSTGEAWIQRTSKIPLDLQFGAELANFKLSGDMNSSAMFLFNNKTGKQMRGTSTVDGEFRMSFEIGGNKIEISVHQSGAGTTLE